MSKKSKAPKIKQISALDVESAKSESLIRRQNVLRRGFLVFIIAFVGAVLANYNTFLQSTSRTVRAHENRLRAVGKDLVRNLDDSQIQNLWSKDDRESPDYKSIRNRLRQTMKDERNIAYAYVCRLVKGKVFFVVHGGPAGEIINGKFVKGAGVMDLNKEPNPNLIQALKSGQQVTDGSPHETKWGSFISSFSPVKNSKGKTIAVVGIETRYSTVDRELKGIANVLYSNLAVSFFIALGLAAVAGVVSGKIPKKGQTIIKDSRSIKEKREDGSLAQALADAGCLYWQGTCTDHNDSLSWVAELKFDPTFEWLKDHLQESESFEELWDELRHPEDRDKWKTVILSAIRRSSPSVAVEYRICASVDEVYWFSEKLTFSYDHEGIAIKAFATDISSTRNKAEEVRKLAFYDVVTGLINRTRIHDVINELLVTKPHMSVIGIEISNFRSINESWGADVGDKVLRELGATLKDAVGQSGTVGRLAGDDFVVIVPDEPSMSWLITKVDEACQKPTMLNGAEIAKVCRVGYVSAEVGDNAVSIIRKSNLALENARKNLSTHPMAYKPEMSFRAKMRVELETAMRKALTDHEFYLEFQPIYCNQTNQLIKAEALLRWKSSRFGTVSPGTFIPIAEESDFINDLGSFVIDETAKVIKKLGPYIQHPDFAISLNLSLQQLKSGSTLSTFDTALDRWGISPQNMIIEITESSIMHDAGECSGVLDQLKDRGFSLAIDDFGTGYSSLATLATLPFNCLKIDKRFVDGIGVDRKQEEVLGTIVRLARALNLKIVAEGIEKEDQFLFLRDLAVEYSQGYYFAKPLSVEDLIALAQESNKLVA